jgi:hypothetical protein
MSPDRLVAEVERDLAAARRAGTEGPEAELAAWRTVGESTERLVRYLRKRSQALDPAVNPFAV